MERTQKGFEMDKFDGKRDYGMWKYKLFAQLEIQGLVSVLDDGATLFKESEKQEERADPIIYPHKVARDRRVKNLLNTCLNDMILKKIMHEPTAYGMWKALESDYQKKTLPNRIYLKQQFAGFKMDKNKSIEENLYVFLKQVADEDQAIQFFTSLPPPYEPLVHTLKYGMRKETLTVSAKTLEKGLESAKTTFEEERRALEDKKSKLEIELAALAKREEAASERGSSLLKKEQELLVAEGKIVSKESELLQKILANQEGILRKRKTDVEAMLESKCKLVEVEIETKRRAWELREVDIRQREDLVGEKEHNFENQSKALADKENDITEMSYNLDEKKKHLNAIEKDVNRKITLLENEKEWLRQLDVDLQ